MMGVWEITFTFNPGGDYNGFYVGQMEHRTDGSGNAVRIKNQAGEDATLYSSELNETNEDGAIFMHVGGLYNNPIHGERVAVSTGCFTLNGSDSGNQGMENFISTIEEMQQAACEAGDSDEIHIFIDECNN